MNLFYLIAIVLVSFFVGMFFLVWMVKKYYWGPTGLPPKERYKGKK
jgi:nitrate reductase NapE component